MKEIGVYLRKEREARKIQLEDVQEITKIRLRYLQAIEEGDLDVIPGEVYRKGFIASYANAIGLDGQEVVEKYNNLKLEQEKQVRLELEKLSNKRKSKPQKSASNDNSNESENSKKKAKPKNTAKKSKKANRNLSKLVIALTVIIILLGLMLVLPKLNGGNQATNNLEQETTTPENRFVTRDNEGNTGTTENDVNFKSDNEVQSAQDDVTTNQIYPAPVTVFAEFTEQVWVQVKSDGKSIFFNNGAVFDSKTPKQVWTAKEQLEIRIGNPAGIKLYFNGKEISQIGERGMPKTIKFNTEGLVVTP